MGQNYDLIVFESILKNIPRPITRPIAHAYSCSKVYPRLHNAKFLHMIYCITVLAGKMVKDLLEDKIAEVDLN